MKEIMILGAGTAGTIVANQLRRRMPSGWRLTVIDPEPQHLYQPGLLFVPFGLRGAGGIERRRERTLGGGIRWLQQQVEVVDLERRRVRLTKGEELRYDILILASGSQIRPEETAGLLGPHWHRTAHDFYTREGAAALGRALDTMEEGRLVVNVVEMPIKCPVAPLEFLFLADEHFTRRGIRDRIELVFATPLDGAFTRPLASRMLGSLLDEKGVRVEAEFNTGEVDGESRILRSWDEREIEYDLLVTVPTHMGAPFIAESGLGDELAFIPTDPGTLLVKGQNDLFALGDATNLQSSKAGSVAHFQSEVAAENVLRLIAGRSPVDEFDGHSNCFIESGFGKAVLIDFNYDVEPLPGRYPYPLVGPLSLLKETRVNHWAKLASRWLYWNAILPARPLPITNHMSMAGKHQPTAVAA